MSRPLSSTPAGGPWTFVKIETDAGVTGYGECSDGRSPHGVAGTIENFLESKTVPWGLRTSCLVLKSLMVLSSEPPVVGLLGDSNLTTDLAHLAAGEHGHLSFT
jgi:hypothetical protein